MLKRGFTIIELLVVITIIVVLLALLVPAMDKAISAAEKTVCASHERQIGVGNFQYAFENKRKLVPPTYNTTDPLDPLDPLADLDNSVNSGGVDDFANPSVYRDFPNYLGSLIPLSGAGGDKFICPTIKTQPYPGQDATADSYTNYMGNAAIFGVALSRIDRAADVALVQELRGGTRIAWYRPWWRAAGNVVSYWHFDVNFTTSELYGTAHDQRDGTPIAEDGGGGGNLLWADGHVSYRALDTLQAGDFGLTGGTGFTGQETDTHNDADTLSYRSRYK